MLKETIRQLAQSGELMLSTKVLQPQIAGLSTLEKKALLGELKDKQAKQSGYSYVWN